MTDATLPEPLVPTHLDLRGLEYMPLLGARLFTSDFDLEATDAEFRAGLRLWWQAWNQVPAASLPTSERALCRLAGFDDNVAKWRKVRERALHGFIECSDGRLYHQILADQAVIAWEKRTEDRAKRGNEAERKARERADRKRMFEQLRDVGVVPAYNIGTADLRALVTQHVTGNVTEGVTWTDPPDVTPPVTRTGTARTGRDGTGRDGTYHSDEGAVGTNPNVTSGAVVCRALKQAGIPPDKLNPSHPGLLALLDADATIAEFVAAVPKALGKDDPFPYILGVVRGQRRDAALATNGIHHGPMPDTESAPNHDAERTQEWLREHFREPTPEEKIASDEARERVMEARRRRG